jgi:hypothetical protein
MNFSGLQRQTKNRMTTCVRCGAAPVTGTPYCKQHKCTYGRARTCLSPAADGFRRCELHKGPRISARQRTVYHSKHPDSRQNLLTRHQQLEKDHQLLQQLSRKIWDKYIAPTTEASGAACPQAGS